MATLEQLCAIDRQITAAAQQEGGNDPIVLALQELRCAIGTGATGPTCIVCPTGASGPSGAAGATGATGPERCNCTVPTTADLFNFSPPSGLYDGIEVFVQSADEWYTGVLDPNRLAVLNTTNPPGTNEVIPMSTGGGFWFREGTAALRQTVYYIHPTLGSDSNFGFSPLVMTSYGPIRTFAELQRRLGSHQGQIDTLINVFLLGDITEDVFLDMTFGEVLGRQDFVQLAGVNIIGQRTALAPASTLTVTTPYGNANPPNPLGGIANDPAFAGTVGNMIVLANGQFAFVEEVLGGGTFRYSPFFDLVSFGFGARDPGSNAYQLFRTTLIDGEFRVTSHGPGLIFYDITQQTTTTPGIDKNGFVAELGFLQFIGSTIRGDANGSNYIAQGTWHTMFYGSRLNMQSLLEIQGDTFFFASVTDGALLQVEDGARLQVFAFSIGVRNGPQALAATPIRVETHGFFLTSESFLAINYPTMMVVRVSGTVRTGLLGALLGNNISGVPAAISIDADGTFAWRVGAPPTTTNVPATQVRLGGTAITTTTFPVPATDPVVPPFGGSGSRYVNYSNF